MEGYDWRRGRWGVAGERGDCQGPASAVVQAPCPCLAASISCSGIFPRGGGAFLRRGRSPSGSRGFSELSPPFLRIASPRPIPGPQPDAHQTSTAGSGVEVSSLSFWGCKQHRARGPAQTWQASEPVHITAVVLTTLVVSRLLQSVLPCPHAHLCLERKLSFGIMLLLFSH